MSDNPDLNEFLASIDKDQPPGGLDSALLALWLDKKGNWEKAHDLINDLSDQRSKSVHAYLHRKEGDTSNAGYWYRSAGRPFYRGTLEDEWLSLVRELI